MNKGELSSCQGSAWSCRVLRGMPSMQGHVVSQRWSLSNGHSSRTCSHPKRVRLALPRLLCPPLNSFRVSSIEIATRAADHFTRIYYTTYDSNTRLADLPQFYRPSSSLTWNGKPFQGADGLRQLIEKMPVTKHDVQSFDCHPIPGLCRLSTKKSWLTARLGTSPPSLLITVSGNVTHGRGPAGNPPNTHSRTIDGHPRVFSQTFMLVPDSAAPPTKAGEVAKYYVSADALRFVG